ncbi:MAG: F0F1 ATP synthase subunit gamma [Verrucomicrobia bacterium]|nr:F0F1 ATP synthase subunit gamma [Verrucomicrobiota bacterium]MBV8484051.1 F0F1 ATP synthase subunit gamma [Verrucomicrobiota bacterium]
MSESMEILRRKISSAEDLGSVVRTMKALAAASIVQYERAVHSLADYYHAIELGLYACVRATAGIQRVKESWRLAVQPTIRAIIFGSDQGLVGKFNDQLAVFAAAELRKSPGQKTVLAIGERIRGRMQDVGFSVGCTYAVPNSVIGITPLVSQILVDQESEDQRGETYVFHNRPAGTQSYEPIKHRLLPLDTTWQAAFGQMQWPTKLLPEVLGPAELTLAALIHEYLFVSLFKACAESLASENTCRLAAMQRAQRNIDDLLEQLHMVFNQTRQTSIDEELFDVISGFEALAGGEVGVRSER